MRVSDRARRFVWPMLNYLVSVFLFRPHIDDCVVSVNRCGGDAVTRFHTHTHITDAWNAATDCGKFMTNPPPPHPCGIVNVKCSAADRVCKLCAPTVNYRV